MGILAIREAMEVFPVLDVSRGVEHLQLDVELVSLSREFYIAVSLAANFFCVKSRKVGAVFGQIFSSTNHGYRFNVKGSFNYLKSKTSNLEEKRMKPNKDHVEEDKPFTWESFILSESWNEFPERKDDPPLTMDFLFWYHGIRYIITAAYGDSGYMIAEELSGKFIIQNKNFRKLVEDVPLFEGKTFKELLPDSDVEY